MVVWKRALSYKIVCTDTGHYRSAVSWLFTTSYRGYVNRWFGEFLGRWAAVDFEPSRPILCDLVLRGSHIRRPIWDGKKTGNIVQDRTNSGHHRSAVSWLFTTSYRGYVNRWIGEFLGRRAAADFEPSRPILCDFVPRERPPKSSAMFNFLADVGGVGMSCVWVWCSLCYFWLWW